MIEAGAQLPRSHRWLFWFLLAAYSAFFAEVFAGSDMFPFFNLWGILVVVPLYGLHTLILITIIYRYGRPTLATLVFAGGLFGLYEAYITKMLWRPDWEAWITIADVAVVEVLVLLWWHTWLSFITPLVLGEGLLTRSQDVLTGLPPRLRRLYGSPRGWLGIALFGAVFQSVNSPDSAQSLLSGLSTVGFLALITLLWRRVTRDRAYRLPDLLPDGREFRVLVGWLLAIYLLNTFAVTPERIPPVWPGQAIIWGLYAALIALLVRALRRSRQVTVLADIPPFPPARSLLVAGLVFILAVPLVKVLLGEVAGLVVLLGWGGGIAFGVWMFVRALRADVGV